MKKLIASDRFAQVRPLICQGHFSSFPPRHFQRLPSPQDGASSLSAIWGAITQAAKQPGRVDLCQGAPNFAGCPAARDAASRTFLRDDDFPAHQYGPQPGVPSLRSALSNLADSSWGLRYDPGSEVLVTSSATEGIYAVCQALLNPGDSVVVVEPAFPWYCPRYGASSLLPRM